MKIVYVILSFCVFLTTNSTEALTINEIMYNPPKFLGDAYNEWIELYNPGNETVNLTGWSISDPSDHLFNGSVQPYGFFILAKNYTAFYEYYNFSCNVTKTAFFLNNDGEEVLLKNDKKEIVDNLTYSDIWGGDGDGNSLQKIGDKWLPFRSTPCMENDFHDESSNQTNVTNDTCDLRVVIECNDIFTEDDHEYFLAVDEVNGGNFRPDVEYWIEDMFGEIVRSREKIINATSTKRSWKPPDLTGTEAYVIHANITSWPCNDTNASNDHAEKIIVSKGKPRIPTSEIIITNVGTGSDEKAKFGDLVEIKMNAYKGETTKSSINVWIEDSHGNKIAKSNFNIYSKFSNQSISIPLQISPNCDDDFAGGIYTVKTEGIDSYDETEILVSGNSTSLCKIKTIENSKPCSCPACQACKCENKSSVAVKNVINKTTEKINAPETGSASAKTNSTNIPENASALKNASTRNENKSTGKINMPTGEIISGNEENWFSSVVSGVINFFKNLFKL